MDTIAMLKGSKPLGDQGLPNSPLLYQHLAIRAPHLLHIPVPHIEVKGLGRGGDHAATLAQELHALDLIKHDECGGLMHVEERPF